MDHLHIKFRNDPLIFVVHDFLWTACEDGSFNLVVVRVIQDKFIDDSLNLNLMQYFYKEYFQSFL